MSTALVVHGHFYQPPRENPWTDFVDREPGAAPFHDWNARILAECYRPNAFARVVDSYGRVERIVNNYAHLSFNIGPTLLGWLAQHDPVTYAAILEADRRSAGRNGGHGNAIAQAYNHTILPLSPPRDVRTQIRWGLADFRHRFGREAEALWLPETACNEAVLGALIDEGLRFVILAPHQAARVRPLGAGEEAWRDVTGGGIDPGVPCRCFHPDGSGRSLAVFFYDGALARAFAFEGGATTSELMLERLRTAPGGEGRLVHLATDGETYGHHTHFADRALAYALGLQAGRQGFAVTNYGAFLDAHEPAHEVALDPGPDGEGTSWSCAHGVGRWARDCGCSTGGEEGWSQAWRAPLRQALDGLRDAAAAVFEAEGGEIWADPWAVRDDYITLVLDGHREREAFLRRHARRTLDAAARVRALTLLEAQRHSMLMFTSCGWFFNDLAGIETVQVLKYAGRLLDDLAGLGHGAPRRPFLDALAEACSNRPEAGSGADIFRREVEPLRVSPARIAAHLGISALVDAQPEAGAIAGYDYALHDTRREDRDRFTLATSSLALESRATGAAHGFAMAAMHFGGIDFYCALREHPGESAYGAAAARLWERLPEASLPVLLRALEREFGGQEFGLAHVLPEGREHIAGTIFGNLVQRFAEAYARLYEDNRSSIEALQRAGLELPVELRAAAEFTLSRHFEEEIRRQQQSADPEAYHKAIEIAEQAARHGYDVDGAPARRLFEGMIADAVTLAVAEPDAGHEHTALTLVQLARRLRLRTSLERAQEIAYAALIRGGPVPEAMRRLGLALGLSPRVCTAEALAASAD